MPVCAGRPDIGRCPADKNDVNVKFSICDLFLCEDCYEFRVPTKKVSDNIRLCKLSSTTTVNISSSDAKMAAPIGPLRNELLCFVQQKCDVMPADQLVKLCADFYKSDEIAAARSALDQCVKQRLPKRQGSDAARKSMEDFVKLCLDPSSQLPIFYATDLARLPPVDASHCDVSVLLRELQALRAEVREIALLKAEVEQLRSSARQESPWMLQELQSLRSELEKLKLCNTSNGDHRSGEGETSQMQGSSLPLVDYDVSTAVSSAPTSFASLAKDLQSSTILPFRAGSQHMRSKQRRPAICGKGLVSASLAVEGCKRADLFVTRLRPDTSLEEITNLVKDTFPSCLSVNAVKLVTKFDTYSSFRIELLVARSGFEGLMASVYAEESWPSGILVRRYFRSTKNGVKP